MRATVKLLPGRSMDTDRSPASWQAASEAVAARTARVRDSIGTSWIGGAASRGGAGGARLDLFGASVLR
ncbi:hypothetical protein ACFSYD_05375 [Paracoccus aerius]